MAKNKLKSLLKCITWFNSANNGININQIKYPSRLFKKKKLNKTNICTYYKYLYRFTAVRQLLFGVSKTSNYHSRYGQCKISFIEINPFYF